MAVTFGAAHLANVFPHMAAAIASIPFASLWFISVVLQLLFFKLIRYGECSRFVCLFVLT